MLPVTNEVVDATAASNLAHTPTVPNKLVSNPNHSASSSSSSSSVNSYEEHKVSNPLVVVVDTSSNASNKDSKSSKESKQNKEKNKEHKLLHRMFHGKDKDKEKEKEREMDKKDREDRSEKVSNKLRPMLANLTPQSSFDSDAASTVSSEKGAVHSHPLTSHHHFVVYDDGTHLHNLSHIGKKESQLLHMFHRERKGVHHLHLPHFEKRDDSVTDKESVLDRINSKSSKSSNMQRSSSQLSLTAKYGQCREVCGKGAFGIVRVAHKFQNHEEQLFAVKEFKKRETESKRTYIKRLTSEFCISSTLHHTNVIHTIDLLPVDGSSDHYAEVMEYCSGGDVFTLVHEFGSLERDEANCFFKQLINGVGYLHKNGVAHRDLKPENLLLTDDGCLKITDFGNGECFRMAWESESVGVHKSKGVCGSGPYIAPEEFTDDEFDPRRVDVWAVGVIYVALLTGRHLWHIARSSEDELFRAYVEIRRIMDERDQLHKQGKQTHLGKASGVDVIDKLEEGPRELIYGMLHPDSNKRLTIPDIQRNEFFQNIWTCHPSVEENPKRLPISTSNTGTIMPSQSVGVKG